MAVLGRRRARDGQQSPAPLSLIGSVAVLVIHPSSDDASFRCAWEQRLRKLGNACSSVDLRPNQPITAKSSPLLPIMRARKPAVFRGGNHGTYGVQTSRLRPPAFGTSQSKRRPTIRWEWSLTLGPEPPRPPRLQPVPYAGWRAAASLSAVLLTCSAERRPLRPVLFTDAPCPSLSPPVVLSLRRSPATPRSSASASSTGLREPELPAVRFSSQMPAVAWASSGTWPTQYTSLAWASQYSGTPRSSAVPQAAHLPGKRSFMTRLLPVSATLPARSGSTSAR